MTYTVKQLAALSGVSARTLHYYDEVDLLKPAYIGENQYRYYEEAELLTLQQILFYKELGFQLSDIKQMLMSADFDKVEALLSHKALLEGDLDRVNRLIKTIDKTVAHLRGETMINLEEIFEGFTEEKQKMYEDFLLDSGVDPKQIQVLKDKTKTWTKDQWLENKYQNDALYAELAQAIEHGHAADSAHTQALIQRHYELTKIFWTPTRGSYIGLAKMYHSHPDFADFYNQIHPDLLNYLTESMTVFANHQLT